MSSRGLDPDQHAVDVDREQSARRGLEAGVVPHPANQELALDEVVEDVVDRGIEVIREFSQVLGALERPTSSLG